MGPGDHTASQAAPETQSNEQEMTLLEGRRWPPPKAVPVPSFTPLSTASSTVCRCDTTVETGVRGPKPFLKCFAQCSHLQFGQGG